MAGLVGLRGGRFGGAGRFGGRIGLGLFGLRLGCVCRWGRVLGAGLREDQGRCEDERSGDRWIVVSRPFHSVLGVFSNKEGDRGIVRGKTSLGRPLREEKNKLGLLFLSTRLGELARLLRP